MDEILLRAFINDPFFNKIKKFIHRRKIFERKLYINFLNTFNLVEWKNKK